MTSALCEGDLISKASQEIEQLETHLQSRLSGQVRDLQIVLHDDGLILRGVAHTYYAKQLAQHAAMKASTMRVVANEIEVL